MQQQARKVRADAERSTARILEAAEEVLSLQPNAPLESIAEAAGLARATVHRRFASRAALVAALADRLDQRYVLALQEARVRTAPPLVAFHRLNETVFELKLSHRYAMQLDAPLSQAVLDGLDLLFVRLREVGAISATEPAWCRGVHLALLHEVNALPSDSPELAGAAGSSETESRARLLTRCTLGALGGERDAELFRL